MSIMSFPSDNTDDYDDGVKEAINRGEEEAEEYVQSYYDSLSHDDMGQGFFHRTLETFHVGPNLPTDRDFYTSPHSLDEIKNPDATPLDHPLRAIAWILNDASENSKIRVFCYRLTDPWPLTCSSMRVQRKPYKSFCNTMQRLEKR